MNFHFETQVFEKYLKVEKAILTAVAESYLQGVSTRRMEKVMTSLGIKETQPQFGFQDY